MSETLPYDTCMHCGREIYPELYVLVVDAEQPEPRVYCSPWCAVDEETGILETSREIRSLDELR